MATRDEELSLCPEECEGLRHCTYCQSTGVVRNGFYRYHVHCDGNTADGILRAPTPLGALQGALYAFHSCMLRTPAVTGHGGFTTDVVEYSEDSVQDHMVWHFARRVHSNARDSYTAKTMITRLPERQAIWAEARGRGILG